MTLDQATSQIQAILDKPVSRRDRQTLARFQSLFQFLSKAGLSGPQVETLEVTLGKLSLNSVSDSSGESLQKQLRRFKRFLKDEFGYSAKGFYTNLGVALGLTFGVAIGAALQHLDNGFIIGAMGGMFLGGIWGRVREQRAVKSGQIYSL